MLILILFIVQGRISCTMIQVDFCPTAEIFVTVWMWTVLVVIFHVHGAARRSVVGTADVIDAGCMITLR